MTISGLRDAPRFRHSPLHRSVRDGFILINQTAGTDSMSMSPGRSRDRRGKAKGGWAGVLAAQRTGGMG